MPRLFLQCIIITNKNNNNVRYFYVYLFRPFGVLHNDNRLGHPANAVFIVDGNSKVRYLSILEPTVEHLPAEVLELVQEFKVSWKFD